jgi:hypothetical protein
MNVRSTDSRSHRVQYIRIVALSALPLLIATPAGAADYAVTSTGDESLVANRDNLCQIAVGKSPCTLRAAIQLTNSLAGPDRIFFALSTSDPGYDPQTGAHTIALTGAQLDVADSLTITGPAAAKLIVANPLLRKGSRLFNITSTGTVNISGITLADGFAPFLQNGGAIQNANSGIVNLTSCMLLRNFSGGGSNVNGGGAIFNAGSGTVNVTASTLRLNVAAPEDAVGVGGAIYNASGTVTVVRSSFEENMSSHRGGGIFNEFGVLTVSASTFRGNGAYWFGGGIENYEGTVSVSNSTFYANVAEGTDANGARGLGGAISNLRGTLNLTNSTLTANFSGVAGSGLYNEAGTAHVKSSLIAHNYGGLNMRPDVSGAFISNGFNLIGKSNGSTGFTLATDRKGTIASPLNAKLDGRGLRTNGGPTMTVALTAASPAVDRGTSNSLNGVLTTDQRGTGFPRRVDKAVANATGGDGTDIGAFELP